MSYYTNHGSYINTREPSNSNDPYKYSAEQFVKQVEEYLYDTASPRYADPHYLAWAIAAFDHSKQGSGRAHDTAQYEAGVRNIPGVQNPPIPYQAKKGSAPVYQVAYPRNEFNLDDVPTNADGTAPIVTEHNFYQIVKSPGDDE